MRLIFICLLRMFFQEIKLPRKKHKAVVYWTLTLESKLFQGKNKIKAISSNCKISYCVPVTVCDVPGRKK